MSLVLWASGVLPHKCCLECEQQGAGALTQHENYSNNLISIVDLGKNLSDV